MMIKDTTKPAQKQPTPPPQTIGALRIESAILEAYFPQFVEEPIQRVLSSLSYQLNKLMRQNLHALDDDAAKRLLAVAGRLETQIKDLEGALFAAKHQQLVYLEQIERERHQHQIELKREDLVFHKMVSILARDIRKKEEIIQKLEQKTVEI